MRKLYGLYDKKGKCFIDYDNVNLFADLQRKYHYVCNYVDSVLNRYADDFCVKCLADIDESTGEVIPCEPYVVLELVNLKITEEGEESDVSH